MNLFKFAKQNNQENTIQPAVINYSNNKMDFSAIGYGDMELPIIKESKKFDYITYGEDNLYPQYLLDLYNSSAIHGAIINGKATMMAGGNILFNNSANYKENITFIESLSASELAELNAFIDNLSDDDDLYSIKAKVSLDWQIYGSMAIEITWNGDHTKIIKLKYVDVSRIRSGKKVKNKVTKYYYSRDWTDKKETVIEIPAFDVEKKDKSQLLYISKHNPGFDYYGKPTYINGSYWITTDKELSKFHLNNVLNGFNPSMTINFYSVPDSPEKKHEIVKGIHQQFQGIKNTGKAMVFFSDGAENAPKVEPVQVNNLDKQYIALSEQCTQQILSAHKVTHPLLFGVQVPGKLGSSSELKEAYQIFDSSVVSEDRMVLEGVINYLLSINFGDKYTAAIEIFKPFIDEQISTIDLIMKLPQDAQSRIIAKLTDDELRNLVGLEPLNV
jgi:hypothetical protein